MEEAKCGVPAVAQWVKDLLLCRSHNCGSDLIPGPGTSICYGCSQTNKQTKKKKERKKERKGQMFLKHLRLCELSLRSSSESRDFSGKLS